MRSYKNNSSMAIHLPMYSRSPKNPTLQLLQKSSKSASTTPQRPIWNTFGTVAVRDFCWENGCMVQGGSSSSKEASGAYAHFHSRPRLPTALGLLHPRLHVSAALALSSPHPCARWLHLLALGGSESRARPSRSAAAPALCGGARALRRRPRSAAVLVLCGGARALQRCSCSAAAPALCGGARALRRCSCSAAVLVLCGGARALRRRPRPAAVHLSTTTPIFMSS